MATLEEVLARDLVERHDEAVGAVIARVRTDVPALLADAERAALARAGTGALLREFATVLRLGLRAGFHAPVEAVAFGQHLARTGAPLADLLRSYRLGQEVSFARAVELLGEADEPDPGAAVARVGLLSFSFADAAMSDVAAAFDQERERSIRRDVARRDQVLRTLLAGGHVDEATAEPVLGRRLRGTHLALVAWREPAEGLLDDVRAALRAAGVERPLLVAEPDGAVGAWLTPPRGAAWADVLARALGAAGIRAAAGRALRDAAGFGRSRRQADLARAVARRHPDRVLTPYADVALAALLTRDPEAARSFVEDELGALAGARHARLRATLAAFYAAGSDQSRTARALGVHRNTVARRLLQAEELLGAPLTERMPERAAALAALSAGAAEVTNV